jgi:hypothetical protein
MIVRLLPFISLALFPASSLAQQAADEQSGGDVIVTGQRLADTAAQLEACLARQCPVDQDIAATLAHAENQFVAGNYRDARATLLASSRRNKKHAKEHPVPVSNLMRANSRVAAHLGEGDAYRAAAFDTLSALRAGLPQDDARILVARVEVGDMHARFQRYDLAQQSYRDVARDAARRGHPLVEGFALLRIAALTATLSEQDINYRSEANRAFDRLIQSQTPEHRPFIRAAEVLKARFAAKGGDDTAIDRLIADYRAQAPTTRPTLIHSEPIRLPEDSGRSTADGSVTQRMATQDFENQWIDVGFWVAPDGRTTDVDMLRHSKGFDGSWTQPVLASIRSRRYAPLKLEPTDPGIMRVERYTFTSRYTTVTGSRLRQREAQPRIEMLDLSTDDDSTVAPTS